MNSLPIKSAKFAKCFPYVVTKFTEQSSKFVRMWFAGYFLLAASTFCVTLGFVPNQLPSIIHKLGLKQPPYIYNSDESDDSIIKQQSSSTIRSGSSNVSFNNGFNNAGYSKQSFSTKTSSSTSIQIEEDSDDSDSLQEFVEDIGEDVIFSSTNMSTSSLTESMTDLDILSERSIGEENLQQDILVDNSEIISTIPLTVEEDTALPTISDQINITEMEDIIEEITEATDTMTLSEVEQNLKTSNLINNGSILPMYNTPCSFPGHPPGWDDVFSPNMMKPKVPGSMMNSVSPNYPPDYVPPSMKQLQKPYPSATSPIEMPPVKQQQLLPTGYIPPLMNLNSLPKPKSSLPVMEGQYKIPSTSFYSMLPPPMKKPHISNQLFPSSLSTLPPTRMPLTTHQLPPLSMSVPPIKNPYGPYRHASPLSMPNPLPKYKSTMPFEGYPRALKVNSLLQPQVWRPQMPLPPTTASETLTDLEYLTETVPQMNGLTPKLPWLNYYFSSSVNMPGMNTPGINMPGINMPGMNASSYIPKYQIGNFNDINETSEYFSNTRNYGSLNSPISPNFSSNQLNTLDSNYSLKYPFSPKANKYPVFLNNSPYPFGSQKYVYETSENLEQNLITPFSPYFEVSPGQFYQKPLHIPTSDNPYFLSNMPNLPYYDFPKSKMPVPMNQRRHNPGGINSYAIPQYSPLSKALSSNPKPWYPFKLPPRVTPSIYPQQLHPHRLSRGIIPNSYSKPLQPFKLLPSKTTSNSDSQFLQLPKLPPSGMILENYPKPLHPPKLPFEMIPGGYTKPLYPLNFPPIDKIADNYPHPVHPLSSPYPQDISNLIDDYPELYTYFDTILISSSCSALIAAKELSDAGKRVLIISRGSYPPPESHSLYFRPQILTKPNYVKTGPLTIPGALHPKKFFYPTFFGGYSEVSFNNWDYGTEQKNQQWGDVSPAWNWQNIVQLYKDVELIPGEIDSEGIIPVNRNLPRIQTIKYITSALQDLGLNDLGTQYSLRDQPGSMMLPVIAEEGPAGLQAVIFAEEVLEDMNNPENVFLIFNTEIESINILGDRAMGVTIKTLSGQEYTMNAQNTIVSGNPGRIAQLLYKSGLGDETVLNQLGISTQQHLPAVGRYWTVSPMFPGSFFTFPQGKLEELGTSDIEAKKEFLQGQRSIQSGILLDHFKAFINIQDEFESNVVIHFYAFTINMIERLNALMEGLFQFDDATQVHIRDLLQTNDILFTIPELMDTKSQGEIVIKSQMDLNFPPTLNSGMYTNQQDMLVISKALQFVESLEGTPTFQMLGANYRQISVDGCIGYKSPKVYNECIIRNLSVPGSFSSGGAIMGNNSLDSVVNQNLQIHGMENLYIMNSAVIPNGVGAEESVATDSLIGEYGANFILRKNNLQQL